MNGIDRMDGMDSDEKLFSQEILQPNFSIDSILDAIEGSDEPAPQNSCAEECLTKASRVDQAVR